MTDMLSYAYGKGYVVIISIHLWRTLRTMMLCVLCALCALCVKWQTKCLCHSHWFNLTSLTFIKVFLMGTEAHWPRRPTLSLSSDINSLRWIIYTCSNLSE